MSSKVTFITDEDDADTIMGQVAYIGGYDVDIEEAPEEKPHVGGGPKPVKKYVEPHRMAISGDGSMEFRPR